MRSVTRLGQFLAAGLLAVGGLAARGDERDDLFEAKIRPVLVGTCFRCHGDTKTSGGLRIDSRETLLQGGDSGPAIVPGKPEESLLIRAIQRRGGCRRDAARRRARRCGPIRSRTLRRGSRRERSGQRRRPSLKPRKHWAFEPIRDVAPPDVAGPDVGADQHRFVHPSQAGSGRTFVLLRPPTS